MARPISPIITPEVEARFWRRVNKSPGQGPHGDCWCWTGPLRTDGAPYPKNMSVGGFTYRVSHVALAVAGNPRSSADLGALHSCDHPPCVKPEHLRWGTSLQNLEDFIARYKNRGAHSFSPDEVRAIRASPERNCDLAKRHGVSQACICSIRKGVTHKHVV